MDATFSFVSHLDAHLWLIIFSATCDEKTMRKGWRLPGRRIAKRVRNRPGMMNEHDIPTDRYNTPRGRTDGQTDGESVSVLSLRLRNMPRRRDESLPGVRSLAR